jgi:hypothetical protein
MSDPVHTTEYRGPEIPTPLGDQLQLALGLDERPEMFGDWVDALAFLADRDDIDVDLNMLCTIDDSPHKATFDGRTQHYQCFQDPIIVPFLADDVDTVEIETESPVSGEPIELRVTETEIEATPSDVVMSFGVAEDVGAPAADVPSPILAYSRFCPYGNVFLSHEEYETWADEVEAITMATDVEDTLELARAIGNVA